MCSGNASYVCQLYFEGIKKVCPSAYFFSARHVYDDPLVRSALHFSTLALS